MDGIKEEMEEAQLKVDIARDSLAADIYSLLAKESEYAKVFLIQKSIFTFGTCELTIFVFFRLLDNSPFGRVPEELSPSGTAAAG